METTASHFVPLGEKTKNALIQIKEQKGTEKFSVKEIESRLNRFYNNENRIRAITNELGLRDCVTEDLALMAIKSELVEENLRQIRKELSLEGKSTTEVLFGLSKDGLLVRSDDDMSMPIKVHLSIRDDGQISSVTFMYPDLDYVDYKYMTESQEGPFRYQLNFMALSMHNNLMINSGAERPLFHLEKDKGKGVYHLQFEIKSNDPLSMTTKVWGYVKDNYK